MEIADPSVSQNQTPERSKRATAVFESWSMRGCIDTQTVVQKSMRRVSRLKSEDMRIQVRFLPLTKDPVAD